MRLVVAGGSGALGRAVADDWAARGHDVVILSRSPRPGARHRVAVWDGRSVGAWASELDDAVLLNLAGELVDRRPTRANVELLRRSRVEPTLALVAAAQAGHVPRQWLQMSTTAIYGDAGDVVIDETHPPADGPPQMPGVAVPWERAAAPAEEVTAVAYLRTGVVLQRDTPALDRLTSITRWGLGGRIGDGRQWVTWAHERDFVGAVRHLADDAGHRLTGPVHVCSPEPVTNDALMSALRVACRRPRWAPPTPRWAVRMGAPLMGTDPALALTGRRCVPTRLLESDYAFAFPQLDAALTDLLAPPPTR